MDIRREAHCLAFHPEGHLLLAASMDAITVVDLRQRSVVRVPPAPERPQR